jgi:hypothetical protein
MTKGQSVASQLEIEEATGAFRKALEYDPALAINPESEAKRIAARPLRAKGMSLAKAVRIKEAIDASSNVQSYDRTLQITAQSWNQLCWWGCLFNEAQDVIFAGGKAVALEQNKPMHASYRDTLGLARALIRDVNGAIEDFQAFVRWGEEPTRASQWRLKVEKRRRWIESLKKNKNPFTDEVRVELRHE